MRRPTLITAALAFLGWGGPAAAEGDGITAELLRRDGMVYCSNKSSATNGRELNICVEAYMDGYLLGWLEAYDAGHAVGWFEGYQEGERGGQGEEEQ